jgi:hypothetical protein
LPGGMLPLRRPTLAPFFVGFKSPDSGGPSTDDSAWPFYNEVRRAPWESTRRRIGSNVRRGGGGEGEYPGAERESTRGRRGGAPEGGEGEHPGEERESTRGEEHPGEKREEGRMRRLIPRRQRGRGGEDGT